MNTKEIWMKVKTTLMSDSDFDENVYNSYFSKARFYEKQENEYYIVVDSQIGKQTLHHSLSKINDAIKNVVGNYVSLTLLTKQEYSLILGSKNETKNTIKNSFMWSFDHFITGPSNIEAFTAVKAVSNDLGNKWNPLFIYGDSGLGKTHLLKAVDYQVRENTNFSSLYLTSDQFSTEIVDIFSNNRDKIEEYKNKIKKYDLLLIDDIQFLAKREKTSEIFFSIFNHFIENNKQIIITSDKNPDALNGFDKRLITRFAGGLTVSVNPPDLETAKSIIDSELKFENLDLSLDEESKTYLATYYSNDIRKIKGAINRLSFWSLSYPDKNNISINEIQDIFKDIPSTSVGQLNVLKIKEVVANKYGVSVKQLEGKIRTATVVNARHLAMYLTKIILNKSLSSIGSDFGGRDHTTVINAISKIDTMIQKDKEFKKNVQKIKNEITTNQ